MQSISKTLCDILCVSLVSLCFVTTSFSLDIVNDYKLNLSSTGPALYGSFIKFDAKLYEGTSLSPQDKNLFKYDWRSDVDRVTETQHADYNTSLSRCFDSKVAPKTYTMEVTVFSLKSTLFYPIAHQTLNFSITSSLNGRLEHNQVIHRHKGVSANVFSTQKPINFLVNNTDKFLALPSFTYEWFLDGKLVGGENFNNLTFPVTKPGKHTVSVNVSSNGLLGDCKGYLYENDLKGFFSAKIILKDPVLKLNLFGHRTIDVGQNVTLEAVFNGSAPYNVCWELISPSGIVVVNQTCKEVPDTPESYIFIAAKWFSVSGSYKLNMSIENDISSYHSQQTIVAKTVPVPFPDHSSAHILVPVICALLAVTLMLFAGVYFINRRRKQQHIESANFDFDTSIRQTPSRGSFLSDIKDTLHGLMSDNGQPKYKYGAMENPIA